MVTNAAAACRCLASDQWSVVSDRSVNLSRALVVSRHRVINVRSSVAQQCGQPQGVHKLGRVAKRPRQQLQQQRGLERKLHGGIPDRPPGTKALAVLWAKRVEYLVLHV